MNCKGAICRHLTMALEHVFTRTFVWAPDNDPDDFVFGHCGEFLKHLSRFYDCILNEPLILSERAAQLCHDSLQGAGARHQALADHFLGKSSLFLMTMKSHYAQHLASDILATRLNPRIGWTYIDEDFVGRVAQIASQCTRARGPTKVGPALFFRHRRLLWTRWSRRARGG